MRMLLAHLADTHLGHSQYGLSWREDDVYGVFEEAFEEALREGVDVILISGDLFDRFRPPNRAVKVVIEEVSKAVSKGVKVYAILGDHDTPKRRDYAPNVLIPNLRTLGVTKSVPMYDVVSIEGREYFIAGVSHQPAREKYLRWVRERISELSNLVKGRKSVLMLHQCIKQFFKYEEGLDLNDIPSNFNYIAMGHIHRRLVRRLENGSVAAYAGSTEILRRDEVFDWEKYGKGFYIVDLSSDEPQVHEVNLRVRPQVIVSTDWRKYVGDVRSGLERLRRLCRDGGFDRGIIHVDVLLSEEVPAREDIHKRISELISRYGGAYLRLTTRYGELRRGVSESLDITEPVVDEVKVVAKVLGNTEHEHYLRVAKEIVKLKNILAGIEGGNPEEVINEIIKYVDVWVNKVPQLPSVPPKPSLSTPSSKGASSRNELGGKGLLKFLR